MVKKKIDTLTRAGIREDIIGIVGNAIEEFARILDVKFELQDSKFSEKFNTLEEKMDTGFAGVNQRIDSVNARLDNHLLDCVRREEHARSEKRVKKVEEAVV